MAPARILVSQPQRSARTSAGTGGRPRWPGGCRHFLRTSARCRRNRVRAVTRRAPREGAWQVASRRRQQGTIRCTKVPPRHPAAQDLELVTKDEQLDVLDVQTAATANERAQQRPEREVEKREGHGRRSSQPARQGRDTSIGTLHAADYLDTHALQPEHQSAADQLFETGIARLAEGRSGTD
jgi:hypothetical protein